MWALPIARAGASDAGGCCGLRRTMPTNAAYVNDQNIYQMPLSENDLNTLLGNVKSGKSGVDFWIGIDPGTKTGFALWDSKHQKFVTIETMGIVKAMEMVYANHGTLIRQGITLRVVVEDTRKLRLPAAQQSFGRLKGVGSVHRDMSIWEEFLEYHGIPYTMAGLSPKEFRIGDSEWFKKKTGWDGRTSEHARAAAGLVYGK